MIKFIIQQKIASLNLLVVLGFSGISWITTTTITPQIAQAYTAQVDVSLRRQSEEDFQNFLSRALAAARAATQRSFDKDILVTEVMVTIMGENQGEIAPVLLLKVNRQGWRSLPDPSNWSTYFPNTEFFLGFSPVELETEETEQ